MAITKDGETRFVFIPWLITKIQWRADAGRRGPAWIPVPRSRFRLDPRGPPRPWQRRAGDTSELRALALSLLLSPAPFAASPFPFHPSTVPVGTQGSTLTETSRGVNHRSGQHDAYSSSAPAPSTGAKCACFRELSSPGLLLRIDRARS